MKKAVLIILTFIGLSSCNHDNSVWTKQYERKLSREISAEISERLPDDDKRQKFVAFIVKRLKEELPKGVESVSKDSLQILSSKIGKEYAYANPGNDTGLTPKLVPWSPAVEQTLKEGFSKDETTENRRENQLLCDCVILKLKKVNPDSVTIPFSHEMVQTVAKECFLDVSAKK